MKHMNAIAKLMPQLDYGIERFKFVCCQECKTDKIQISVSNEVSKPHYCRCDATSAEKTNT